MDEEVLTERQVQSTLGLESNRKPSLVVIGDAMYKREPDGNYYRLLSEIEVNITNN